MARKDGSTTKQRNRVDVRELLWTAMRIHKRFTTSNLLASLPEGTKVGKDNLKKYIQALHRAKYLCLERPRQSGKSRGHAIWRLARDTGPRHPLMRRDQEGVWDQNQQKLYPYGQENRDGQQQNVA